MSKIILGSGLSGLSAAYYLLRQNPKEIVTLIEASNRVGGWIKTNIQEDGTIYEQGPRTIRPKGESGINTLQLIDELNLSDKIVPINSKHPAAKNRMIYVNNELHALPTTFGSLFTKHKPFSQPIIMYLMQEFFKPKKEINEKDESIYDFCYRRFGSDVADYLISPMICGICGGNAKEISVKFLMEPLFDKEQTYGSISKGIVKSTLKGDKNVRIPSNNLAKRSIEEKWSVYSFKDGMETLPKRLESKIKELGAKINLNSEGMKIKFEKDKVTLYSKEKILQEGGYLISSIPAGQLGELVKEEHPELETLLKKIKSVSIGVVNLKFKNKIINREGFGFLIPPKEKLPLLGVIYDSCCFPKGDCTILTAMMGGYWFHQYFGDNPNEEIFLKTAVEQIQKVLKIKDEPVDYKVNILKNCIPQYVVGHAANLEAIRGYIRSNELPLAICGSSYDGVGINDVILSAKKIVEKL